MNQLLDYTIEQMRYIDSVDGNAHITAVAIIGALESQINTTRAKLTAETARADAAEKLVELVRYECRVTSDDYAPDSMPFEVADVVGRIETALEQAHE